MKKTQFIELLAQIRATIVSFLSIVMFVALGVGVFLGIRGSAWTLERSAEQLFTENSLHDIEVVYPYGMSDDDIDAIRAIDGVSLVTPSYRAYALRIVGDKETNFALHSITDALDICTVIEGEMPKAPNEMAVSSAYAAKEGVKVGDYIEFAHDATDENDPDGMRYLTEGRFKVTALVTSPLYITQMGGTLGVSASGDPIGAFAFLPESSFDTEAFGGLYPSAFVRSDALRGSYTFTDEYRSGSNGLKAAIEAVGEPRANKRFDEIYRDAQAQLDDAAAQIAEGERMLEDGRRQIEEGEDALVRGEVQLEAAISQLESGQATYEETAATGEQMLSVMESALAQLQTAYDTAKAALDANAARVSTLESTIGLVKTEIDTFSATIDSTVEYLNELDLELLDGRITQEEYAAARQKAADNVNKAIDALKTIAKTAFPSIAERFPAIMEFPEVNFDVPGWENAFKDKLSEYSLYVNGAQEMLDSAVADFNSVLAEVNSLESRLSNGWAQYYAARDNFFSSLATSAAKLEEGREQAAEGRETLDEKSAELEEGKKTLDEKSAELDEGKAQYDEAKAQVDALVSMNWIVNTRFSSGGAIMLDNVISLTNNLRIAMASLFLVVGLLVCYSAVSRIVHDQVTQIGAKKALGFKSGEITLSYLVYTAFAVLIGAVIGQLISVFVVQAILSAKIQENFDVPNAGPSLLPQDMLFIIVVELVLLLLCTWFACHSVLKRSSLELLAGEQKTSARTRFYERWGMWRKLPLFTQTVINNCVNDPRRVFATLIGVAGCTALVVTASMLKNNISRSIDTHYGEVYRFNATVNLDTSASGALDDIDAVIDGMGYQSTPVYKLMLLLEDGDNFAFDYVFVPSNDDEFAELFDLSLVPVDGTAPTRGVWLSESHAEHRGLKVGDTVTLSTATGERYTLTIAGFFSFYVPFNTAVMSSDYYEQVFGSEATPNAVLVNTDGAPVDDLSRALNGVEGFRSVDDEQVSAAQLINLFSNITTTTVLIYIALSVLMAIVVLLNLDVMFIDEKKRELIVLMINGFSVRDAKRYIYRDAIVMTVLGILVGIVAGTLMGAYTVSAVEWQSCAFIKSPDLFSCLLGAGISAALSAIMMAVSLRRIPRFSLTDISKL